jgi:hypothetical protein
VREENPAIVVILGEKQKSFDEVAAVSKKFERPAPFLV